MWWVAIALDALLLVLFAAAALVLVGSLRTIDDLSRRLDLVVAAMPGSLGRTGLAVGTPAPSFEALTLDGAPFSSASLESDEHLVVFAHPGCPPCESLLPALLAAAAAGRVPPAVVVSDGSPADHPLEWRDGTLDGRARIVVQDHRRIAKRFESFVTPHVFYVDPEGVVRGQGIAGTEEEVRALVRQGRKTKSKTRSSNVLAVAGGHDG